MQRVRIGLTGLACVFLLVLIGTASIGNEAPAAKTTQPEEPLAQLGVAPGAADTNKIADPAVPADQPVPITPPPAPVLGN